MKIHNRYGPPGHAPDSLNLCLKNSGDAAGPRMNHVGRRLGDIDNVGDAITIGGGN